MLLISQRQFFNFESKRLTIRNENIWSITTIMTISERRLEMNEDVVTHSQQYQRQTHHIN